MSRATAGLGGSVRAAPPEAGFDRERAGESAAAQCGCPQESRAAGARPTTRVEPAAADSSRADSNPGVVLALGRWPKTVLGKSGDLHGIGDPRCVADDQDAPRRTGRANQLVHLQGHRAVQTRRRRVHRRTKDHVGPVEHIVDRQNEGFPRCCRGHSSHLVHDKPRTAFRPQWDVTSGGLPDGPVEGLIALL